MVYNTQNHCFFLLCPSSGIIETRKHNVSETGSFFRSKMRGGKRSTQLGPSERANFNHHKSSFRNVVFSSL
jgi:hypothetical protein